MPKYSQSAVGQALKAMHDQNHMEFSVLTEGGMTVLVVVSNGTEIGLEWWGKVGMVQRMAEELARMSGEMKEGEGEEIQCLRG